VLPEPQGVSRPCARNVIENWEDKLCNSELQANQFAAEILLPRKILKPFLGVEPSMDSVRSIAAQCETSLTASAFQLTALTTFRTAVVWSYRNGVRWYKASDEFVRWIRKGELSPKTFAADCFRKQSVPDGFESVPASAWLFEKGLMEAARIWEHSVALPSYEAVLTLLVIRERIEAWDDSEPNERELDPREFTLDRTRWPAKR
jgi:hypothetical protein